MCKSSRIYWVLLVSFMMAAACAPQTEVVKLYENQAAVQQRYVRLFVIAISSDPDQRHELEDRIIARLRHDGTEAVPSYSVLGDSENILQDDINQASIEAGADAILITHTVSVDSTFEIEEGRKEIMSECRGGDPVDFFLYDHEVLAEPDSVKVAHTVVMITNLYDVGSRDRIWSIQSTCFDRSTMSEVLLDEAIAIVRQLHIDKLI